VDPRDVETATTLNQRKGLLEEQIAKGRATLQGAIARRDTLLADREKARSESAMLSSLAAACKNLEALRSLEDELHQIDDACGRHARAKEILERLPTISESDVAAAVSLDAKINAFAEAESGLLVEVTPLGGAKAWLAIDGETRQPIESPSKSSAQKSVVVDLPEELHVAVHTQDASQSLQDLARAREALAELLRDYGAVDVSELSRKAGEFRKAADDERGLRTRMELATGGKDVNALRQRLTALRSTVGAMARDLGTSIDCLELVDLPETEKKLAAAQETTKSLDSDIVQVEATIAALDLEKKTEELADTCGKLSNKLSARGCTTIEELIDLRDRRVALLWDIKNLKERAGDLLGKSSVADLEKNLASLDDQVKSLEAKQRATLQVGPILDAAESDLVDAKVRLREAEDKHIELTAQINGIDLEELQREETEVLARETRPAKQVIRETEAYEMAPESIVSREAELTRLEGQLAELRRDVMKAEATLSAISSGAEDAQAISEDLENAKRTLERLQRQERVLEILKDAFPEARTKAVEGVSAYLSQVASSELKEMTDGRYSRVEVSRELVPRVFSDARGDWIDADGEPQLLSAGTVDQVLLALRLSIAGFMSNGKRPPILMDDPFVHFDPDRRGKAMDLLKRASSQYQIVVFTCHDYKEMAGCSVIELK
jgi:DNA repair exonuclease SbcCD ATPase subunit